MATSGFPGVPVLGVSDMKQWTRIWPSVARVINSLLLGKSNNVISVTLTASSATTVISDPRLGPNTFLGFMPRTANAAAEIGAGTLYVSSRGTETATLTNANNAQADRTFSVLIVG